MKGSPKKNRLPTPEKETGLIKSFNYAIDGILFTLKSQRNMKVHYTAALAVLFFSLFFNLTKIEMCLVFFAVTSVVAAEMINTAIEKTVDLITGDYSPFAKIAKDVAAGAVLVLSLNAVLIGYILFFDKLSPSALTLLNRIRAQGIHVTIIGLLLTVMLVIGAKTFSKKGSHVQGGIVSGHAALAFALSSAIAYSSANALVALLALLLALLVAQSRVEGQIHTLREVVVGAVLGTLVMTLLFQLLLR